jgi:hypothetical protein
VVPTGTPIPTLTAVTKTDQFYSDLTVVEVLLPTGAGSTIVSSLNNHKFSNSDSIPGHICHQSNNLLSVPFSIQNPLQAPSLAKTIRLNLIDVQLFYTAPTSCASRWVYSTTAFVGAPDPVTFEPTSVSTIFTQPIAFGPTSTEFIALVNPTDIPSAYLSSLSNEYAPPFTQSCSIPYYYTATGTGSGSAPTATPGSGGSSGGSSSQNDWLGCTPFAWYFAGAEMGSGYICFNQVYYVSCSSGT